MDFKVKNLKEIKELTYTILFNRYWNIYSRYLDLLHKLPKDYKKWDWSLPTQDKRTVNKGLGRIHQFSSAKELVEGGLLRENRGEFSTADLAEEMLRREVMAQMDDAYWVYAEAALYKDPRKPKKRKKRPVLDSYVFRIEGICRFLFPKNRFCLNSPYFKEAEAKARAYLTEHKGVFHKRHRLEIMEYTEKVLLSTTHKFVPIEEWKASQKTKKEIRRLRRIKRRKWHEKHGKNTKKS